jgi:hypothetical protein
MIDDRSWLIFFRELYLGFGLEDQLLERCVKRAYLDFNRTWYGAREAQAIRSEARTAGAMAIIRALKHLQHSRISQKKFDTWHAQLRRELGRCTDPSDRGNGLTLGQSQKWINMSIKYVVGGRLEGFSRLEAFAHIPIDRIILAAMRREPSLAPVLAYLPDGSWSRLTDETGYEGFQKSLREKIFPKTPLGFEFHLWMKAQKMTNRAT